ncbi:hypothetical protein LY76DRAFT_128231 [Colletotrichum caudatum]|nr:hypothetical protein LY76DRAFT_128231 [Colletotrichum caudatum]
MIGHSPATQTQPVCVCVCGGVSGYPSVTCVGVGEPTTPLLSNRLQDPLSTFEWTNRRPGLRSLAKPCVRTDTYLSQCFSFFLSLALRRPFIFRNLVYIRYLAGSLSCQSSLLRRLHGSVYRSVTESLRWKSLTVMQSHAPASAHGACTTKRCRLLYHPE